MHKLVSEYLKSKKISLPTDYEKVASLMHNSEIPHFILDLRGVGSHWFLGKPYQMLNPKHINSSDLGQYEFLDNVVRTGKNVFKAANESFAESIVHNYGIERSMVIAIANTMVERDTGLLYQFDENGQSEGLYAHSLDLANEGKVKVADSLLDIFEIPETDKLILDRQTKQSHRFKRKNPPITVAEIDELCSPFHTQFDLGFDSAVDYEQLMSVIVEWSDGVFNPDNIGYGENDSSITVSFEKNGNEYTAEMNKGSSRDNKEIVKNVNILLGKVSNAIRKATKGYGRYFEVYIHPDHETQLGLVLANPKQSNIMSKPGYLILF